MSTVAKTIARFPLARVIAAFAQYLGILIEEVHLRSILDRYAIRVAPDDTGREPRGAILLDSLKVRSVPGSLPPVGWINLMPHSPSAYTDLLWDPTHDDPSAPDLPRLIANYALVTEASRFGTSVNLYLKNAGSGGRTKIQISDGRISAPEGWATPTKIEYVTALCGGIAEMADLVSFKEQPDSSYIDLDKLLAGGSIKKSSDGNVHGRLDGMHLIEIFPDGTVELFLGPSGYTNSTNEVVLLCASLWAASVTERNVEFNAQFNVATRTGGKTLHLRCQDGVITEQPTSPA